MVRFENYERRIGQITPVLEKYGFRKAGTIYTDDGSPRIAYERMDGTAVH